MNDRPVHPGAWWVWMLGLAATAARTTNLIVLILTALVVIVVAMSCRIDGPLGRSVILFTKIAVSVVLFRLVLQAIFGLRLGDTVLFRLPALTLPDFMAGITVGGPVTLESMVAGLNQGVRLGVILICFGAVNSVSSPARLLRSLPGVLYEMGVASTIALTTAPQAVMSASQLSEARRLRGRPTRGPAGLRGLAIPVLEGALDRSIRLAAALDTRGYGRTRIGADTARRRGASVALIGGLILLSIGIYGVFDTAAPVGLVIGGLTVGSLACAASVVVGHRTHQRTRHRPIRWDRRATIVALSGAATLIASIATAHLFPGALQPSSFPLVAPTLPFAMAIGLALASAPLFVAPRFRSIDDAIAPDPLARDGVQHERIERVA